MAVKDFNNQEGGKTDYRGHLPPPFSMAKDERSRVEYPSEPRPFPPTTEDVGNYGTGGYYGNTYRQDLFRRGRDISGGVSGHRDTYRHLGDRRWPLDTDQSWEREHDTRYGYRSIGERMHTHQGHRGKGPRAYQRRDQRIYEDLNDRLSDDPFLNATDIEASVKDGDVILAGTVDDRQSKRRAEDIAESIAGVRNVENRLRIVPKL